MPGRTARSGSAGTRHGRPRSAPAPAHTGRARAPARRGERQARAAEARPRRTSASRRRRGRTHPRGEARSSVRSASRCRGSAARRRAREQRRNGRGRRPNRRPRSCRAQPGSSSRARGADTRRPRSRWLRAARRGVSRPRCRGASRRSARHARAPSRRAARARPAPRSALSGRGSAHRRRPAGSDGRSRLSRPTASRTSSCSRPAGRAPHARRRARARRAPARARARKRRGRGRRYPGTSARRAGSSRVDRLHAVSEPVVHVAELTKIYKVPEREAGLRAAAKALFKRQTRDVRAVEAISFDIGPGEIVGFLGPNGAGKTTTLKMLSGLLYPTSGEGRVLGHVPSKREREYLRRMTLVMGNRNQLQWDLPALDSFELNRAIYRLPRDDFRRTRDELIELLDIGDLVRKPVRNLSLGERMKVEVVGSLLHLPQVLYLDEPTIGLDVTMQKRIRSFIAEYNLRYDATVLLTSHYMADVEALCERVIVIHHGALLFDGQLAALADRFAAYKTIEAVLADGERISLRVPKSETSLATA